MASIPTTSTFNYNFRKYDRIFQLGFKSKTADFRMAKWDVTFHSSVTQPATIVNDLIIKAHDRYGNLVTAINALLPQECQLVSEECLWFYDLNQDMGPKNPQSLRKLERLLDALIEDFDEGCSPSSSTRFRTVALYYLHWAMVTQGVYHVSRRLVTSRGKSERYWAPILVPKKPAQRKQASDEVKYKGPSHTKENVIPKFKAKINDIIEKIETIIRKEDYAFDKRLIVENEFRFSLEINNYLTPHRSLYLGANGAKKLNKLYQELQKAKAQLREASITAFREFDDQIILDDGTWLKLKQERKQENGERVRLFSRDVMPLTGAAAEEAAVQDEEEAIPDSWEDIAF